MMQMDDDLLRTFLELQRTRHFGKAAENLFVSQSTVSARIRLLEEKLGVALFSRIRNDIRLTPAGKKLVEPAQHILETWNEARRQLATDEEGKTAIGIGCVAGAWDVVSPVWITAIPDRITSVSLTVEIDGSASLHRRLLDRSLDLALTLEAPQSIEFDARELMRAPVWMVSTAPFHAASDAVEAGYIWVDWGQSFSVSHGQKLPQARPMMRIGSGRIALDILLKKGGCAYLAEPLVRDYVDRGVLLRVDTAPAMECSVFAVYPAGSEKKALLEDCLALLPSI